MSALEDRLRDLYEQRKALSIRLAVVQEEISEGERLISDARNGQLTPKERYVRRCTSV